MVDSMKFRIGAKISNLSELDRDPLISLQQWRVLMGRKKKVTDIIQGAINAEIVNHQNEAISPLIVHSMSIDGGYHMTSPSTRS